ncbi:28S ribosomal protein S22, mitochondrial [Frankliniella fusca]|uniref:28S ribosomal protein S22, mitochondrial n=1 Tax=Frankliniella fusca TaxID=407009 RepID=A0AAE1H5D0_9NEOP|nr:28S ribosomal protein S22, mitochondrial [Frankliniella fusca]
MALACRTARSIRSLNKNVFCISRRQTNSSNALQGPKIPFRPFSDSVGVKPAGSTASPAGRRDPAVFFFNDEIQSCLLDLNMREISKVFEPRKEGKAFPEPEVKFLTQEELDEELARAQEDARYYLQLPPVLLAKEDQVKILSKDPELQGLEESKILVTDISFGVPHHERIIVARDTDGTLRTATIEERQRVLQTYFPQEGRSVDTPQLFSPDKLKPLLEKMEYEFVLDKACAQFEPDERDYVSVTSITYDHIDENGNYDVLVGTRHYGSLAFYLIFNGRHDKFLKHCISTCKIMDAVTIVKVFYLTRPDITKYSNPTAPDDTSFLKEYISLYAKDKAPLSMALNAYLELKLPTAEEESSLIGNK